MEEKLKAPDSQSGDSEVRLFQRCQELQASVQEKEDVIAQLEQQLEEQVKYMCNTLLLLSIEDDLSDLIHKNAKMPKKISVSSGNVDSNFNSLYLQRCKN